MLKLIYAFFTSKPVKLLIRIIASFASAIVVVSGYLFIVNLNEKNKEEIEIEEDSSGLSENNETKEELQN